MGARSIGIDRTKSITVESAQTVLATPTLVTDGVALDAAWEALGHRTFRLLIWSAGTTNLTVAHLFGWDATAERWVELAHLNAGTQITLTATRAWARPIELVEGYTRFAVGATLSAAEATTVVVTPITERE